MSEAELIVLVVAAFGPGVRIVRTTEGVLDEVTRLVREEGRR